MMISSLNYLFIFPDVVNTYNRKIQVMNINDLSRLLQYLKT